MRRDSGKIANHRKRWGKDEARHEVRIFIVTDKADGATAHRSAVWARNYSRRGSFHRGIRRAYSRLLKRLPKETHTIQMHMARTEYPLAHLG